MPTIHKQELEARRAVCNKCQYNNNGECLVNGGNLKWSLLSGTCPKNLWPTNFKPIPYNNPKASLPKPRPNKEPRKKPPALTKQIKSFTSSMRGWAKDQFRTVSPEEHKRRLAICEVCPSLDPTGWHGSGRCLECGCAVKAKTKIRSQKCPIGKW